MNGSTDMWQSHTFVLPFFIYLETLYKRTSLIPLLMNNNIFKRKYFKEFSKREFFKNISKHILLVRYRKEEHQSLNSFNVILTAKFIHDFF